MIASSTKVPAVVRLRRKIVSLSPAIGTGRKSQRGFRPVFFLRRRDYMATTMTGPDLEARRRGLGMTVAELARRARLGPMRTRRILIGDARPTRAELDTLDLALRRAIDGAS